MKNGFLRALRHYLHVSVSNSKVALVIVAVVALFAKFLDSDGVAATYILIYLIAMPMFEEISSYSQSYKYTVGLSCTRKNLYLAGLVHKVVYGIWTVAVIAVLSYLFPYIGISSPFILLFFFVAAVFSGLIGTFEGLILAKLDRHGFLIYMISTMAIIFGAIIYVGVLSSAGGNVMERLATVPTVLVMTAAIAVIGIVGHLISKKVEVRG